MGDHAGDVKPCITGLKQDKSNKVVKDVPQCRSRRWLLCNPNIVGYRSPIGSPKSGSFGTLRESSSWWLCELGVPRRWRECGSAKKQKDIN